MKKFKIILSNILLLIIVFCFAEYLAYKDAVSFFEKKPNYSLKKEDYNLEYLKQNMRPAYGLQYKKAPILIYGCSYAYGFALEDKENFGYQISEQTKRPVYNFAISSKGLQDALYLIQNDEKITPEPQYVFYVFINDHVRRMYVNCNKIDGVKYLTYKNKNGKLIRNENQYVFTERLYLTGVIKNALYYLLKNPMEKSIYKMVELYFITIKKEINNKYPNAKFIILDYENGQESYLNEKRVRLLKEHEIEIVNLNKIFHNKLKSDKYRNPIDKDVFKHPNAQAWSLVTEYVINRYNLKNN